MPAAAHGTPYQQALDHQRQQRAVVFSDPEAHAATLRQHHLIGGRIRQARDRLGLTQGQLGMQLDVDRSQVSSWERGRTGMRPITLERIAEAVGEPIHYFYGGPSAHPLPAGQDPDPYAQPAPPPANAMPILVELLLLFDRLSKLLTAVGRNGELIDTQLGQLRQAGYFDLLDGPH